MTRFRAQLAASILVLATTATLNAQTVVAPAFTVGTPTFANHLQDVDVVGLPDGSFAAVWGDYDLNDPSFTNNHAALRRFSATGVPLDLPIRIDTSAHVLGPKLALDGQGGLAAAWLWIARGQYRYFGQRVTATGQPRGEDFQITADVSPAVNIAGPVVGTPDGPVFFWDEDGMWARRLDRDGHRRGGDMRVGFSLYEADLDIIPSGGFVVTWADVRGLIPNLGRVFDATGQPRGREFALSQNLALPHVAADPRGGFVVVGIGTDLTAHLPAVLAQRFALDGTPVRPEFVVVTGNDGDFLLPDVSFDSRGNFLVAWAAYRDGGLLAPRAMAFDSDDVPLGPPVTLGEPGSAGMRTARLANDDIVAVWYWNSRATGVLVRLCADPTAVCGDGARSPACEECDDGAANGNAPGACRADCRRPRCGDGVVDPGELCDDGNATACDGCSPTCIPEAGVVCGDGVVSQACAESL